jgi:hypothetical protein
VYLQSRSKRWLGVLRRVRPELQLAKKNVIMYAEVAKRMPGAGVRVISERDQQVMTVLARDSIALTFESQRLVPRDSVVFTSHCCRRACGCWSV